MSIINRIILIPYMLLMIIASILVICFVFNVFYLDEIVQYVRMIPGKWQVAAVAGVFLVLSIIVLFSALIRKSEKSFLVGVGQEGAVSISAVAVKNFVEKAAMQVPNVHNVKASVSTKGDALKVKLTAGILPNTNVPEVSQQLQAKVKESVKETVGKEVADVQVLFNTIAYENTVKSS